MNDPRPAFRFRLDLHSGVPVYRQIIDQVRGGIASGALAVGDQLPTVRQLAVDLSINPNTVVRAYRELELGGSLVTHQGTGTFISTQKMSEPQDERERQLAQIVSDCLARAGAAGFTVEDLIEELRGLVWGQPAGDEIIAKSDLAQINNLAFAPFMLCVGGGALLTATLHSNLPIIAGVIVGLYFLFALKVVQQWEKVALLRMGRYVGLRGPGMFFIVPLVETLSPFVDQRVRVSSVTAESALTRDTVPVNVDAIIFWLVWNAEKAILEVEDFMQAINMSAQTALRESIGRHELAQMIADRETLGKELQKILDEKTNPWGITVQSVEVRDVKIPRDLEDAMSRQAQAERERQARIILGQAETEISDKFVQAAAAYERNPTALHLRAMNMLYEAIKERGAMVIVPSSAVETMGLGGMLATTSLAAPKPEISK